MEFFFGFMEFKKNSRISSNFSKFYKKFQRISHKNPEKFLQLFCLVKFFTGNFANEFHRKIKKDLQYSLKYVY